MLTLPYGAVSIPLDPTAELGGRRWRVLAPPTPGPPPALEPLLAGALAEPIGRPALARLARRGDRVTIIVSDHTRDEPRAAFLAALRRVLPDCHLTIAIATGTHGPVPAAELARLGLASDVAALVNHDGHRDDDLVAVGTTPAGTPVRVHRSVIAADLVIATGCIRPHYFAGYGAGSKAVFPGLGAARDIRINHARKTLPGARAGVVDDNPCRRDLEDAARLVPTPLYLLNGVVGPDGAIHAAVAGDPFAAFRAGAAMARALWAAGVAAPAPVVVASDAPPVTDSLYQAAKIYAAMAPLVAPGGVLVVAADCAQGVGPGGAAVVDGAILRIGVLPRLADGVRLALVSSLGRSELAGLPVHAASSVGAAVAELGAPDGDALIAPHAAYLLVDP